MLDAQSYIPGRGTDLRRAYIHIISFLLQPFVDLKNNHNEKNESYLVSLEAFPSPTNCAWEKTILGMSFFCTFENAMP
ncbi:hypothetical protein LEMLEM_LOCUS23228 [Lemmus lemmus]